MKYSQWIILVVALNCFILASCNNAPQTPTSPESKTQSKKVNFRDISVEDLPTAYGSDAYTIIDVRTPEEIAGGMIDDAIHIDFVSLDFEERLKDLDKNGNYIVYCRSGGRSSKTSEKMKKLGFKNVCNLEGGYLAYTAGN